MPQNNQQITQSPEFKKFCKDNNLEVSNLESINLAIYKLFLDHKDQIEYDIELDKKIQKLEKENNELREMIMEVAKLIKIRTEDGGTYWNISLFDKWNNK